MDYKQAYLKLFNTITDVIGELEKAQIVAETIIINDTQAEKENIKEDEPNLTNNLEIIR